MKHLARKNVETAYKIQLCNTKLLAVCLCNINPPVFLALKVPQLQGRITNCVKLIHIVLTSLG